MQRSRVPADLMRTSRVGKYLKQLHWSTVSCRNCGSCSCPNACTEPNQWLTDFSAMQHFQMLKVSMQISENGTSQKWQILPEVSYYAKIIAGTWQLKTVLTFSRCSIQWRFKVCWKSRKVGYFSSRGFWWCIFGRHNKKRLWCWIRRLSITTGMHPLPQRNI